MKAISVKQPWASAIVAGQKCVENRTWSTSHRGPLLIHASLGPDPGGEEILLAAGVDVPENPPLGMLLGIVDLVGVVEYDPQQRNLPGCEFDLADDPLATGPVCWILENPRPIPEPIPYKGQQGLFNVPDDVIIQAVLHTLVKRHA